MAVKIDMDMPKGCQECPLCEMISASYGKCKVLPIRDLDGDIIDMQRVVFLIEKERSVHCPMKEIK